MNEKKMSWSKLKRYQNSIIIIIISMGRKMYSAAQCIQDQRDWCRSQEQSIRLNPKEDKTPKGQTFLP